MKKKKGNKKRIRRPAKQDAPVRHRFRQTYSSARLENGAEPLGFPLRRRVVWVDGVYGLRSCLRRDVLRRLGVYAVVPEHSGRADKRRKPRGRDTIMT